MHKQTMKMFAACAAAVAAGAGIPVHGEDEEAAAGGASVGPAPMEKYRFDTSAPVAWSIDISPVSAAR